ncbi:MAG: DNA helicase RecQ [Actinobacteria bacterium]|nr:DNA helicase RecQ [Actinomycetota bacterium]
MLESPPQILQEVFGYGEFRGEQGEIIDHVLAGGDALVLMPTGAGKSLCYQVPAIARHRESGGVTIVVSPLIALMHDQVAALHENGVEAAFLNSALSPEQFAETRRRLLAGELTLLYAAPERVTHIDFLVDLATLHDAGLLAGFAIDEAHCVSQWGHDFRPEYTGLSVLHERFPDVPRIALTATADELTREEIAKHLDLGGARRFVSSFDRPNIHYCVVEKREAKRQLLNFIRDGHDGEAGIVYCLSRRKVEETAKWLNENGIVALPYHAGLDANVRRRHQDRFLREDGVVMTATIAFGMGIDKPDVRFVAHLDLPKNIEGYYQETGRAGRDGDPADAWMAYGLQDVVLQRNMLEGSEAGERHKQVLRGKLDALLALCESTTCRRVQLLAYFGEHSAPCGNCDNCVNPPETWDAGEAARKLLSCIYRCDQNFGSGHVFDVLRGKQTEKVERFGHDRLSTFGIGADLSEQQWRAVLRQLIASGMVRTDPDHYNVLRLAGDWREFITSEQPLPLRHAAVATRAPRAAKSTATEDLGPLDAEGEELFERLRAWRREQAEERDVPAYVIFGNATLHEIALKRPATLAALAEVKGVGDAKLENFGEQVLELVVAPAATVE